MSATTVAALISLLEAMISDAPELYAQFKQLFTASAPSAADFAALRAQILTPYSEYDPTPLPGNIVPITTAAPAAATPVPITILPQPALDTHVDPPSPAAQTPNPTTPANAASPTVPASSLSTALIGSQPSAPAAPNVSQTPAAAAAPAPTPSAPSTTPPTGSVAPATALKAFDYGPEQTT